ncbi:MAG: efflux RND transporter periplasmic adaptor subunit [Proteobacteria bacterium]|nr:efflux RND transporter periplasmic adaptor subunit [Pseudomonadota bacterium]
MHRSNSTPLRALLVAVAALTLAACGKAPPAADAPRPALVVQASTPDLQAQAFAGVVVARQQSPLAFQVGGHLVRRLVDMGARVKQGQVLAQIDPRDVALQADAAKATLATAQSDLALAQSQRTRYRALAQQQAVSRAQMDTVETQYQAAAAAVKQAQAQYDAARNQAGYADLRAPADGVIAQRLAEAGQVVAAGQPIFTLAADGQREVQISIPEQRVAAFKVGMPVLVELWTRQGAMIPGHIREIAPLADPQARTYAARVELPTAANVELGQSARVYAADPSGARLSVPLAALYEKNGAPAVWVAVADGKTARDGAALASLHLQPVQLGPWGEDAVPVLAGISGSDWILAAGVHLVREGQVVEPVDRDNRPVSMTKTASK